MTPLVSVVVPVYCNRETLAALQAEIVTALEAKLTPGDWEVVYVDDGSHDDSLSVLRALRRERPGATRVVRLSRNFGSHAAILAGLSRARGRYAAVIGADLQEPPSLVLAMLDTARAEEAEVVLACRFRREEGWSKVAFANVYYAVMRRFSQAKFPRGGFDCFLIARPVIDALLRHPEANTSIAALILWMGFRQATVEYVKAARAGGASRWTLRKKLRLVLDSVMSFSHAPIRAMELTGLVTAVAGLAYAAVIVGIWIAGHREVAGWSSLMVVVLVMSGLILVALGIVGEYLWRILDAARRRPVFVIAESWEGEEDLS